MAQHQWVKHTVEPIAIVEVDRDDGSIESGPEYFRDPSRPMERMYGCSVCNALLTMDALKTDCAGESSEPESLLDVIDQTPYE